MERRTNISEEVWAKFDEAFEEVDKAFLKAGETFKKANKAFEASGRVAEFVCKKVIGNKGVEIPLTLKNRLRLIRLAFSRARWIRF